MIHCFEESRFRQCALTSNSKKSDEEDRMARPPLRKSIYQHPDDDTWHVNVEKYNLAWPSQFEEMRNHLHDLFTTCQPQAPYQAIEHIGSTSIPGLAAKPNIDLMVIFDTQANLDNAIEALLWEIPKEPPYTRYTQIPAGGGIAGRESFKIYLPECHQYYASTPERNLYLIAGTDDNTAGRVQIRCYRTVKRVLLEPANADLFTEYAEVKLSLSQEAFENGLLYAPRKDGIIRKILLRGGWTEAEIDEKESLSKAELTFNDEMAY